MKELTNKILVLLCLLYAFSCSKDSDSSPVLEEDEEEEEILDAPTVPGVYIDDISNNGDVTDLEISFERVSNETFVSEYRIFIVKSSQRFSFDLEDAVGTTNFVTRTPDGSDQKVLFDATARDADGDAISLEESYVGIVLSVADGENAINDAISAPSLELQLSESTLKITYIGNDGVYISDGEKGVIVDALPGNLSGWKPIASGIQNKIERGSVPFDDIRVSMVTHAHGDHVSTSSVGAFLGRNTQASFMAPAQLSGVGSGQRIDMNLSIGESIDTVTNEIPIRAIRIRHFNPQDGTDFASTTENYAYLIELGGKKVLHIGDGDLSTANFESLGLVDEGIDIVLIPTFNFSNQLTATKRDVLLEHIAPEHIIGLHLAAATSPGDVTNLYPNAVVFLQSLQTVRY